MKIEIIIVTVLLLAVSTPIFAARSYSGDTYNQGSTSKFYMGLGAGSMKTDIQNLSTTAVSWSLFAGSSVNRNLAIEVAYTNLGNTDLGGATYLKGTTYSLNLIGNIPVTQAISMFAKFGFANTGVYSETGGASGTTYSLAAPTIGMGAQATISRKMDVRIAYDNYKFTTNNSITYNADITSLSVIYRF